MEKEKIWYKTEFVNSIDQIISIYEDADDLVIETTGEAENFKIYLNKDEALFLGHRVIEMSKEAENINCKNKEEKRSNEIWENYLNNHHNPYRINP